MSKKEAFYFNFCNRTLTADISKTVIDIENIWSYKFNPRFITESIIFSNKTVKEKKEFFQVKTKESSSNPDETIKNDEIYTTNENLTKLPIIKSLLQKAIRRKDENVALMAAKSMMTLNLKSFVRRLLIIALEDSILDSDILLALVWFFKASSVDFTFQKIHLDFLLGIVLHLVQNDAFLEISFQDNLEIVEKNNKYSLCLYIFINSTDFFLENDEKMFNWYHSYVKDKIKQDSKKTIIENVDYNSIEFVTCINCPLYAIDFHNSKSMVLSIQNSTKQLDAETITNAIWYCRSGINSRKSEDKYYEYLETFEKIEKHVDNYSKEKLKNLQMIN